MGKKLPTTIYYEEIRALREKADKLGEKNFKKNQRLIEKGKLNDWISPYWEMQKAHKKVQREIIENLDCGKCPNSLRCTLSESFGNRRYINLKYGKARIRKHNITSHYDCCMYSQAHSGDRYVNLWNGVRVESEIDKDGY